MKHVGDIVYDSLMIRRRTFSMLDVAVRPSRRTLRAELLRLCARIGYSPPIRL